MILMNLINLKYGLATIDLNMVLSTVKEVGMLICAGLLFKEYMTE